jgi:hypothetical protein
LKCWATYADNCIDPALAEVIHEELKLGLTFPLSFQLRADEVIQ